MDIKKRVGNNIRDARLSAGLSQWELVARVEAIAENTGFDQSYISGLEAGRRNPTLQTLWMIARAIGVPLTDLVAERAKP